MLVIRIEKRVAMPKNCTIRMMNEGVRVNVPGRGLSYVFSVLLPRLPSSVAVWTWTKNVVLYPLRSTYHRRGRRGSQKSNRG